MLEILGKLRLEMQPSGWNLSCLDTGFSVSRILPSSSQHFAFNGFIIRTQLNSIISDCLQDL